MDISVEDFVGSWEIRWVGGYGPFKAGWYLELDEPTLDDPGSVGFRVLDADGHVQDLEDEAGLPKAEYTGETLYWEGVYQGKSIRLFASLATVESFKSIYGATVWGDPDQVGVWGGGAGTPPPPPSGG